MPDSAAVYNAAMSISAKLFFGGAGTMTVLHVSWQVSMVNGGEALISSTFFKNPLFCYWNSIEWGPPGLPMSTPSPVV